MKLVIVLTAVLLLVATVAARCRCRERAGPRVPKTAAGCPCMRPKRLHCAGWAWRMQQQAASADQQQPPSCRPVPAAASGSRTLLATPVPTAPARSTPAPLGLGLATTAAPAAAVPLVSRFVRPRKGVSARPWLACVRMRMAACTWLRFLRACAHGDQAPSPPRPPPP